MAKKTFWWGNFKIEFLKAVIEGEHTPVSKKPKYNIKEIEDLMPFMDDICEYPNANFVKRYRREIENYFLDGTNHLVNVMRKLEKVNFSDCKVGTNDEMMFQIRSKRLTQTLLNCYVQELRSAGKNIEESDDSIFVNPTTIDLRTAEYGEIPLYSFQEDAVDKLEQYFVDEDHKSGLLVMPTGSGKTRTSVYFLLKDMISKGYQVLWLAHRWMLLEQAAEQFYSFSSLITTKNKEMEKFKFACISGKHSTISALEKDDNVIISSVQSLCNKTAYLPAVMGEKVVIVIDEAHHSLAPSYRRIIDAVRKLRPEAKLLGLTATPVRMNDNGTKSLMHMYEDKPIYSITMSDLIAQKKLAIPVPKNVETNLDISTIINIDEEKYIRKWGEMPESLVKKVAQTNKRNQVILKEYLDNADKYGKTIIFAMNAIHCDTLNEMMKAAGVRCDYVYNLRTKEENQRVIDRFKYNDRPDGIDVLININILTEGSDIPDIQTVFLTRPTNSDVLLMQMVGRGMRGVESGGTEFLNVIDFCDKWPTVIKWMHPEFLLGEELSILEPKKTGYRPMELIPMQMVRDIAQGISYSGVKSKVRNMSLPVGWFDVNDEDGNDTKVLVFENQLEGYKEFEKDMQYFIDNDSLDAENVIKGYFKCFGAIPLINEIREILAYIRESNEFPLYFSFNKRDKIDPFKIANKIKEENMNWLQMKSLIKDVFDENSDLILSLYDKYEKYEQRVLEHLTYENGRVPIGTRIEEVDKKYYELSNVPLKKSLDELLDEVIDEMRDQFPEDFQRPNIDWTNRDYNTFFAQYRNWNGENQIYINSILNSISVDEEVVKYLIYHECLHQEMYHHGPEFREKEHKYPNFLEYDHFLDYKFQDYVKDAELVD